MKARIHNTNIEIEVRPHYQEGWFIGFTDVETGLCYYGSKDLDFPDTPAWDNYDLQAFRRETAKDILCAMVSGGYHWSRVAEQADLAAKYADELINALRDDTED